MITQTANLRVYIIISNREHSYSNLRAKFNPITFKYLILQIHLNYRYFYKNRFPFPFLLCLICLLFETAKQLIVFLNCVFFQSFVNVDKAWLRLFSLLIICFSNVLKRLVARQACQFISFTISQIVNTPQNGEIIDRRSLQNCERKAVTCIQYIPSLAGLQNIMSKESKINRRMDNKSQNNLQPIKVKKENPTSLA